MSVKIQDARGVGRFRQCTPVLHPTIEDMGSKLKLVALLFLWTFPDTCIAGPLGGAAVASHALRAAIGRNNGAAGRRSHRTSSLDEKPHVVHPVSKDPAANLPEKHQVIDRPNEGSLQESPSRYQLPQTVSSPIVARSNERRLGSPVKDTSSKNQERPQVPPRVPLPARPYGERDPVPQIPVPPSQNKPGPPRWPAYPRPPLGYGVPVGNIQVPTTPKPPSCFYKSERYEHGDSVETPEPCLNCTCQKGVLVCYLRVCPVIGTPAPGCFTARESGQCCPSVFCSGDKKTTTTPPPPTDDDYYDYPATVDYDAEATTTAGTTTSTTTTTTTTTTRRPTVASTRRYSFAPKPVKRPHEGGLDDSELSARTPSVVVVEQAETTTTEADATTTTAKAPSKATEKAQMSAETTTARQLSTTVQRTTEPPATSSTPGIDDIVTVTATRFTPTVTTSLPTTTFVTSASSNDTEVTTQTEPPTTEATTELEQSLGATTGAPPTTTDAEKISTSTKSAAREPSTTRYPPGFEDESNIVVATKTTTSVRPTTVATVTESPILNDDADAVAEDREFVAGTEANDFGTPVRKPQTDDEPRNSVDDILQDGRDSIMFVSSTPMPYELHHSFDLQDLNSVSGGKE